MTRWAYTRDPSNFLKYNKAVEGFIEAYHSAREGNLRDLYSKLDPADPQVIQKMDKITGPQVRSVIQPLRDQNGDIQFDDKEISDILVKTHIIKEDQFYANWKSHVD